MTERKIATDHWTVFELILFRFIFILFLLFIFFYNNGLIPFLNTLTDPFILWLSRILKIPFDLTIKPTGSGDTTYHYLLVLFAFIVSIFGCIIWTLLDRKSTHYNALFYWLNVGVRFFVGLTLIQYGLYKIIKMQFPFPNLSRLTSAYGDSSPMGLAWTFLGFSTGYNLFMGAAEMMGILLLFRRTVTLGAIISLMTTANVMAINYFYDVPVKILSTALVLMSVFLLAPNFNRLIDFFLKGKAVSLRSMPPPVIQRKWIRYSMTSFKFIIIFFPIIISASSLLNMRTQYGDAAPKLPLYGVYNVEIFTWTKDKDTLREDSRKWERLIIERKDFSTIKFANKSTEYCTLDIDTVKKKVSLVFNGDPKTIHHFTYQTPDPDHLIFSGFPGDYVTIEFEKQHFQLMERGFKWVSEYPYNR